MVQVGPPAYHSVSMGMGPLWSIGSKRCGNLGSSEAMRIRKNGCFLKKERPFRLRQQTA